MRGNTCIWGLVTRFGTTQGFGITQVDHHWGGGVAYARQGDPNTYCLVFLIESVV